ncbi:MAG: hypothetical protein LBJ24_08125 [Treponema sp.]|jgi:hypothetical protein|nr:hypothetical protein [Treponema sp.]
MDFLFDNGLFVVLAIVIFVVRLFLQLRAKGREKNSPPPDATLLEEADEEEKRISYANTRSASDYFREGVEQYKTAPARKTAPPQIQAADFRPHWLEEPEEKPRPVKKVPRKPQSAVLQTMALPSAEPASPVKKAAFSGFPENLAYLSSLKRAVALAEILGTPRGLN